MCWKRRANIHWFCERIRLNYFPSQTRFDVGRKKKKVYKGWA